MRNGEARKAIRQFYADLLGQSQDPERVYLNRVRGIWEERIKEGPVFLIYNMDTRHESQESAPLLYENWSQMVIQAIIRNDFADSSNVDDRLDDLADFIEATVFQNVYPDFVSEVNLVDSNIVLNNEGSQLFGSVGLHFNINYRSEPDASSSTLDDLLQVVNTWPSEPDDVTDTVNFTDRENES